MAGLDFNRLAEGSAADSATEPRRIFSALPAKASKYSYPRDVQTEVWERWHDRRTAHDLVIKMNTGSGKTVVGLFLLKSCLNEGVSPAVYVSPDNYLADQVRAEAAALGIETTDDPHSGRFLSGKAVLVVNIYKLVNGLSTFGVTGSSRPAIELGTVLIDDAHACLSTVEEQFTLRVPDSCDGFGKLLGLFADDLRAQSAPSMRDLADGDPNAVLRVPSWAWADRSEQVLAALHPHRATDEFKFVWPLIAECLPLCHAAVTIDGLEIRPPCPPIDRIPSMAGAMRRIYLTATLADDSVLVTHFAADAASIAVPITPRTADDIGDRMILMPLEIFSGTSDEQIRDFLAEQAARHNVVIIVPSRRRAEFWRGHAAAIHDAKTIQAGVEALRRGHVGLVVLINKYDGIDLPGTACRILALDGVPEAYGALDRLEAMALEDSDAMLTRQVQRIEQGMGRGVRSNDDFCVVMLLGSRLTQRIHNARGKTKFSPATRAQLDLSSKVADMLHGHPLSDLAAVVQQCLDRDTGWVIAGRAALDGVTYDTADSVTTRAVAEREAFNLSEMGRYRDAAATLQRAIDATADRQLRGWLKQQGAAYLHMHDPVAAQALQTSAQTDNRAVLKPRAGVQYHRLKASADQAQRAAGELSTRYATGTALVVGVAAILDDLVPDPEPTAVAKFEQAVHDLGLHLGFAAQRPERDTGQGPDVLWMLGALQFLVIECKSAVTTDFIARHDAAQLSHSMDWFTTNYDTTCSATPMLVHPTAKLHKTTCTKPGTRVITFARLSQLRAVTRQYALSLSADGAFKDPAKIADQLQANHFTGSMFATRWTVPPRKP